MKSIQERIAAFPAAILVDLDGLHCATRYGIVSPGERGYQPMYVSPTLSFDELNAIVLRQRGCRDATPQEREAALCGSMFGWDCKAADPAGYVVKVVPCSV